MNETVPAGDSSWVPQTCTLPTTDKPTRLAEFDELFATAVQHVHRTSQDGVRLQLRPEATVAAMTADLMLRETGCCSFFTFTLTATAEELALDVTTSAAHTDVLDALAKRVAAAKEAL